MNRKYSVILLIFALSILFGCSTSPAPEEKQQETTKSLSSYTPPPEPEVTIKLATTTSCDNSGLLKHILPDLLEKHRIEVDVIAVGTGKALEHGCAGDVDVVLVHAPASEFEFIEKGCGTERFYVGQNEFVIIGPEDDPAGLKDAENAIDAMEKLAEGNAQFISRGDNSGTHKRELSVWKAAGIEPSGDWYIEAGQGMGAVLTMANEQKAYTLTDTGTYYAQIDQLQLPIAYSGDELLENVYSVIKLNPEKYPDLKHDAADIFIEWITSDETAKMINDFKVNGYQLFKVEKSPDYKNKP